MDYEATLQYLYAQLPMYQRIGQAAFKKDLTNIRLLCERLGNPHEQIKTIHIAGTNGKGSVSHALAAIFQQAGYKTGLYISPHYRDFRERIKINGSYIEKEAVVQFVAENFSLFEEVKPSFFEMTVAMAFWYFAQKKTDIAIIETGLGGRLDSTNIITPLLSVITNISFDHMNMLGNTLAEIAYEKAGIIKPNVPVVIGEVLPETDPVFRVKATQMLADIYFVQQSISCKNVNLNTKQTVADFYFNGTCLYTELKSDLAGAYQIKNLQTVIQVAELLPDLGFNINRGTVAEALGKVAQLTNFIGRWHVLQEEKPLIIADSAHNEDGVKNALQYLLSLPYKQLHIVLGVASDKNLQIILPLFPKHAIYYFCKADVPRGMPSAQLQKEAAEFLLTGQTYESVTIAYNSAKKAAGENDLVFITGSIFVVAEVI